MTFVDQGGRRGGSGHYSLVRWFAASATLGVPQAAGPVAFSLVALELTGETAGGAAMILAMTVAQVAGAIPLTRLTRGAPSAAMLRLLIVFRAAALACLVLCTWLEMNFVWLVVLAAAAGLVNGAAYGHLRALLNHFTSPARLPRALGIAATLNETIFVLGPVAASALATVSPVLAVHIGRSGFVTSRARSKRGRHDPGKCDRSRWEYALVRHRTMVGMRGRGGSRGSGSRDRCGSDGHQLRLCPRYGNPFYRPALRCFDGRRYLGQRA